MENSLFDKKKLFVVVKITWMKNFYFSLKKKSNLLLGFDTQKIFVCLCESLCDRKCCCLTRLKYFKKFLRWRSCSSKISFCIGGASFHSNTFYYYCFFFFGFFFGGSFDITNINLSLTAVTLYYFTALGPEGLRNVHPWVFPWLHLNLRVIRH